MEVAENKITYNISKHCAERYAERIMGKEDNDVNRFIVLNEDKIKTDINKLISYGELIYQGKQSQKDGKGNVVDDCKSETVLSIAAVSSIPGKPVLTSSICAPSASCATPCATRYS